MKQNLPSYLQNKKNIFYLGSQQVLQKARQLHPDYKQAVQLIHLTHAQALPWLKEHSQEIARSPRFFAILCTEECARNNNYQLLDDIQLDPVLRMLPFLIYSTKAQLPDAEELLRRGADDYINLEKDWKKLDERLDFWLHYKDKIYNYRAEQTATARPKMSIFKRLLDIIGAAIILLLLSPLLAIIALAIKLESKGPVLYTSKRVGTNYRIFEFLKFRSMYQDADQRLQDLMHLNQYSANIDEDECFLKIANDPRVTRVGRLIRKTSLDELPQLINVLKGEMSLVGNRPLPMYEAEHLTRDDWAGRFLAPAGLTGLWQVTKRGKNDMSTQERVQLDLNYAQLNSFWFDMGILIRTLPAMIQEEDV